MTIHEHLPQTPAKEEADTPHERKFRAGKYIASGLAATALIVGSAIEVSAHSGGSKEGSAKGPVATAPANPGHEATSTKSPEAQPATQPPHFEVMGKTYDSTGEDAVDEVAESFKVPADLSTFEKNQRILNDFNTILTTRDKGIRKLVVIPAAKKALIGKTIGGDADGMLPPTALFSTIESMANKIDALNANLPADHAPYSLTLSVNTGIDGKGVMSTPVGIQAAEVTALIKSKESGGHSESLDSDRVLMYGFDSENGTTKLTGGRMDKQ